MHIHASMASAAHRIGILRRIILSNCGITEFDTTLFAATCQIPDVFRTFWPKDLEDGRLLPSQPAPQRATGGLG